MTGFVRACRLAAAFILSVPMVTAAQAATADTPQQAVAAPVAVYGPPAPAAVAAPDATPAPATRVTGAFQAPAITAGAPAAPTAAPVAPQPVPLADLVARYTPAAELDQTSDCLAKAVYFEARGESLDGQLAVAEVVLNRAASEAYPDDICAVVTQKAQFSFVRRGRLPQADETSDCWRRAVAIAFIARNGLSRAVPENVLWYHANYVSPGWGKRLTEVARIGAHIFYS